MTTHQPPRHRHGGELPTPTQPLAIEGPYRRQRRHRQHSLNNTERLALALMLAASALTAIALMYVLGLAVSRATSVVTELLALVWS